VCHTRLRLRGNFYLNFGTDFLMSYLVENSNSPADGLNKSRAGLLINSGLEIETTFSMKISGFQTLLRNIGSKLLYLMDKVFVLLLCKILQALLPSVSNKMTASVHLTIKSSSTVISWKMIISFYRTFVSIEK